MKLDNHYLTDVLVELLNIPSPTGDTARGTAFCKEVLCAFDDLTVSATRKGTLVATWPGQRADAPRGVTAHIDTLGAMVKEINPNGRLRLSQLGSYDWTAIENEGVTVQTARGAAYRGTVLFANPSYHVHKNGDRVDGKPRAENNLEVRVDARTGSAEETRKLGIEIGDFVYLDPRVELNNGFIRSRHLDDKACLACLFTAVKALHDAGQLPAQRTTLHIANYEEVCHGGSSGFPEDLVEVLAVDVAPLGTGQNSDEYSCSLGMLDADGPYDPDMNRKLRRLAVQHEIPLRPDIYPQYASDAKALWKAGADVRVAVIGPGVDDTHGYERTHFDALIATTRLIVAYLLDEG
ncbi:MAG TPA: M42 family metallopeptidase [Abditibacteriaceae bacterium]|nr:M42 family metallopeptidase [Abditibacteriaceae bacterium]